MTSSHRCGDIVGGSAGTSPPIDLVGGLPAIATLDRSGNHRLTITMSAAEANRFSDRLHAAMDELGYTEEMAAERAGLTANGMRPRLRRGRTAGAVVPKLELETLCGICAALEIDRIEIAEILDLKIGLDDWDRAVRSWEKGPGRRVPRRLARPTEVAAPKPRQLALGSTIRDQVAIAVEGLRVELEASIARTIEDEVARQLTDLLAV